MKLPVFLLLVTVSASAQTNIKALSYSQTQDESYASNIVNGSFIEEYISKDGSSIKAGSPLQIGRVSTPGRTYTYVYAGRMTGGSALMGAVPLDAVSQAENIIVEDIKVYHTKMSRKSPLYVLVLARNPSAPKLKSGRTITNYEQAFLFGEILNPNAPLSRDGAIAKLKEWKDLLDLGVITQAKYDSLKAILSPIINGN